MCVLQNLCHSTFCTLIWEPWTGHGRHFGLCHWFGIELCTPCPSLSVEINDACFWPCIKISTHTHTQTPPPFLPRTLTCAFNLLYSLCFSFTAWLGNVPSMNIQITWLLWYLRLWARLVPALTKKKMEEATKTSLPVFSLMDFQGGTC